MCRFHVRSGGIACSTSLQPELQASPANNNPILHTKPWKCSKNYTQYMAKFKSLEKYTLDVAGWQHSRVELHIVVWGDETTTWL